MKVLYVDVYISLELYLLERDKIKLRKRIREHKHSNIAKRKDTEHTKIRQELEKRFKNSANTWTMGSI